jgi:hypothetical protein
VAKVFNSSLSSLGAAGSLLRLSARRNSETKNKNQEFGTGLGSEVEESKFAVRRACDMSATAAFLTGPVGLGPTTAHVKVLCRLNDTPKAEQIQLTHQRSNNVCLACM